jgi:hypothetical protein
MKVRALTNFAGVLTMQRGEEKEYDNEDVLSDLLRAGYIERVESTHAFEKHVVSSPTESTGVLRQKQTEKDVKPDAGKRNRAGTAG